MRWLVPLLMVTAALVLGTGRATAQRIIDPSTTSTTAPTTTSLTTPSTAAPTTTTTAAPTTTAPAPPPAPTTTAAPTTTTTVATTTTSIPAFAGGAGSTTTTPEATHTSGTAVLPALVLLSIGGFAVTGLIVGAQFVATKPRPRTRNGRPRGGGRTQSSS